MNSKNPQRKAHKGSLHTGNYQSAVNRSDDRVLDPAEEFLYLFPCQRKQGADSPPQSSPFAKKEEESEKCDDRVDQELPQSANDVPTLRDQQAAHVSQSAQDFLA